LTTADNAKDQFYYGNPVPDFINRSLDHLMGFREPNPFWTNAKYCPYLIAISAFVIFFKKKIA
jgi:hypothetical protein